MSSYTISVTFFYYVRLLQHPILCSRNFCLSVSFLCAFYAVFHAFTLQQFPAATASFFSAWCGVSPQTYFLFLSSSLLSFRLSLEWRHGKQNECSSRFYSKVQKCGEFSREETTTLNKKKLHLPLLKLSFYSHFSFFSS